MGQVSSRQQDATQNGKTELKHQSTQDPKMGALGKGRRGFNVERGEPNPAQRNQHSPSDQGKEEANSVPS